MTDCVRRGLSDAMTASAALPTLVLKSLRQYPERQLFFCVDDGLGHESDGWAVTNIEGQSLLHRTKQNANGLVQDFSVS